MTDIGMRLFGFFQEEGSSFKQLMMSDSSNKRETFIYKLSKD